MVIHMSTNLLPWNGSLGQASRLPTLRRNQSSPITVVETATLVGCGIGAAVAVIILHFELMLPDYPLVRAVFPAEMIQTKLRIPGHSILRAVFPMALGLALVPRRGAGTLMGISAAASVFGFSYAGWGDRGLGAITSLMLIGPCLDLAMRGKGTGKRVYFSFIIAGVLANLAAMSVQIAAKSAGWRGTGTGKSLALWLPNAAMTYPICGAIAGLIGALVWFRWNAKQREEPAEQST